MQLQTAFGGGKTHTMLAVYHVASGKVAAKKMLGIPELLDKAQDQGELVRGNVAVLDGNSLAPCGTARARTHHPRRRCGASWLLLGFRQGLFALWCGCLGSRRNLAGQRMCWQRC